MSIKRLFDAVERRGDIGRRVAALVLPITNRPRVTSSCAGEVRLREPGEHTSGPNLASRDNVAHNQNLYIRFWKRRHRSSRFGRKAGQNLRYYVCVMRYGAECGSEAELRYLLPHPHQACSDVDDR